MRFLINLVLAALLGNAAAQPAPQGPDGFRNNYPHPDKGSLWAWQWERLRNGLPKAPADGWKLPFVKTDPVALGATENNPSVTWIGHATMLVRLAGQNIPWPSSRSVPTRHAGS